MAKREAVWAIDEDGKPCLCYAKPENRGKRNCRHRFHQEPGESKDEFFKKFRVDSTPASTGSSYIDSEISSYSMDDLPELTDQIRGIVSPVDCSANENISEKVLDAIYNNPYMPANPFEGVDINVDEKVSEDGKSTIVTMTFDDDGEVFERSFEIPRMDELGEYEINGTKYRYIPTLDKNKLGVSSANKYVYLDDRDDNTAIRIAKAGDTCAIWYEDEDGKRGFDNEVPLEEVQRYLNGEPCELPDRDKETIDALHPIAKQKIAEAGGIAGLRELPRDQINDLDNRRVLTYADRVAFTLGKKFRSMSNVRSKSKKAGRDYDYSMEGMTEAVKKGLTSSSYMQIADDINPIAAMSQSQKVSWTGEGSWKSSDLPNSVRSINPSYYGLADPSDVSLGGRIGASVAVRGRVKNGVLVADPNALSGSDFIPYIEHSDPNRSAMAISHMREACPLIGGEDPKTSTKGWDRIKGSKLGVNLNVAYVPTDGVWEDAVVISESAAKRMTTVQSRSYTFREAPTGVSVGDRIERGQKINGQVIRYPGKVRSIEGNKVEIESVYPMSVGDKLSGRYGNKGVVSKVLPDSEMPKVDGKPADVIMSPIGIAGRSNLGQVLEVNDGDLNKTREIEYKGHKTRGTGGTQYIIRINQIAEKKLLTNSNRLSNDKEYRTRFGEMESLLLSTNEKRLDILRYLRHQESSDAEHKLLATLRSVGIDMRGRD